MMRASELPRAGAPGGAGATCCRRLGGHEMHAGGRPRRMIPSTTSPVAALRATARSSYHGRTTLRRAVPLGPRGIRGGDLLLLSRSGRVEEASEDVLAPQPRLVLAQALAPFDAEVPVSKDVATETETISNALSKASPLATALVLLVVVDWILGAKIHHHYLTSIPHGDDFSLIIRYLSMSLGNVVLLPVANALLARSKKAPTKAAADDNDAYDGATGERAGLAMAPSPERTFMKLPYAGGFAGLYFVMGVLWMESLPLTTVGLNCSLYNCSYVLLVFALSLGLLRERVTPQKIKGVACTLMGGIVLGIGTMGSPDNTPLGFALVVASAAFYAMYQVGFAKWIKQEANTPARLLQWTGLMGAAMTLAAPVVGGVGLATGTVQPETLQLVLHSPEVQHYLFGATAVVTSYMLLLLSAIQLSSPLFVSTGTVLTVPVSFLVDFLTEGQLATSPEILGSVLICCGFLTLTLSSSSSEESELRR